METAIKKAIEGGWEEWGFYQDALLDPLFWQALGKVEGWDEKYCTSGCGCEYPNGDGSHEKECVWSGKNEWIDQMHNFIDHIIEGKSIDEFFTNLLTTA